ncbi:MAG: hypothetical protein MJ240_11600 [Kiritimatiellae bacterium]|nr:hypothetical protein [Kiritimatiellia bacterium]
MKITNTYACWALALVSAAMGMMPSSSAAGDLSVRWPVERKKVVSFGWEWNAISPSEFVKYADRIDQTGLDGVGVYVKAKGPDGKSRSSANVADGEVEWTHKMVEDQIADFRTAMAHKGLKESFIRALGSPHQRLDWADDVVWGKVARSMGTLAWLAKEGGFRGLMIDPEDYHKAKQFCRRPGDEPWHVLAPLARKRGREVFSAVFREYPEAVIFAYWFFSWNIHQAYSDEPMVSARCGGDLWSAFVNGMLDVIPPTARLVDGNEWAYENEASRYEFMHSAIAQRNCADGLVAPENRMKYRAQVLPGFGLYLDSYTNDKTNSAGKANHYYFGPDASGSRTGHFARNLSAALRASGGYVWLWGEKFSWINYDPEQVMGWHVSREHWETRLPGLSAAVRACANPSEFLMKDFPALRTGGAIVDLAEELDVAAMSAKALGKEHDPKNDAQEGSGYFHIGDERAIPGSQYVVVVDGHGEGLDAIAYWLGRKDGGYWRWRVPGQGIALKELGGGRRHGEAVITVPEGVDGLKVQFRLHPDPGTTCGFDKVFLGKIDFAKPGL